MFNIIAWTGPPSHDLGAAISENSSDLGREAVELVFIIVDQEDATGCRL